MTDIYKPINEERNGAPITGSESYESGASSNDTGRVLLAGVVGGVVSAAGYLVYSRLPDEQREKLQAQARLLFEQRVNELRSRFNL